jgi:hypothetical protein
MNKNQKIYCKTRRLHNYNFNLALKIPLLTGLCTALFGAIAIVHNPVFYVIAGAQAYNTYFAHRALKSTCAFQQQIKDIKKHRGNYPYENITDVDIVDIVGLEMLLKKTKKHGRLEWGTFFKTKVNKKTGTIDNIMDPKIAESKEWIKDRSEAHITPDFKIAEKSGYTGFQHYHPSKRREGSESFSVHYLDRRNVHSLELLTFSLGNKPEIIAFNKSSTFIPSNSSKTQLVKATHADIINYLATC